MRSIGNTCGFSLLELIISIAIMGVLAGIAVPNYISYLPKARLNGATTTVMADLMSARMKAIKLGKRTKVFFVNSTQYTICDDANGDGTVASGEGDVLMRDIQSEYMDVTISSTNNPIFHPRGTASNLATVTFQNGGGSKSLTVNIAGMVKIQ